jgi:hypothetical protein
LDILTKNNENKKIIFFFKIQTANRVKIFAPTPTPKPIADLILKNFWNKIE